MQYVTITDLDLIPQAQYPSTSVDRDLICFAIAKSIFDTDPGTTQIENNHCNGKCTTIAGRAAIEVCEK